MIARRTLLKAVGVLCGAGGLVSATGPSDPRGLLYHRWDTARWGLSEVLEWTTRHGHAFLGIGPPWAPARWWEPGMHYRVDGRLEGEVWHPGVVWVPEPRLDIYLRMREKELLNG